MVVHTRASLSFGHLDGNVAYAARTAVNQNFLPRPQPGPVKQRLPGRNQHQGSRRRCLKSKADRLGRR